MSDFENLDHYELLGVSRTASLEEIKRAYRREISKYHPDRFVNAPPDQQEYAQLRSQRITEAYSVLSDFASRSAYNRGQQPTGRRGVTPSRVSTAPVQPRDHQAELYEQARDHLTAGRTIQAIGTLRQLQQINPFYRDSAELLATAEAQIQRQQAQPARRKTRPILIAGGLVGGVALAAAAAWALRGGVTNVSGNAGDSTAQVALVATEQPSRAPEPTFAPAPPTEQPTAVPQPSPTPLVPTVPPPTLPPTEVPTPLPTEPPTEVPTMPPEPTPVVASEEGPLLLADAFGSSGWADLGGNGWRVGYQGGRYRIAVDAGIGAIWSYRTAPARNFSLGVDMQVLSGEGGIMLRFLDENNYLSVSLNPQQTSFRLEQHSGGAVNVLAGGQSEAIAVGTEASNRLVARLRGDHLQVLANGQLLAEIDAPGTPNSMRYGLLGISGATAAEAFFDNLEIRALE